MKYKLISKQIENREVLICPICNKNPIREGRKTCSIECSEIRLKEKHKQYFSEYRKREYVKQKYKKYHKKQYQRRKKQNEIIK